MRLIHFPYEILLIWTSFCPTFSYYFDETLNPVANSSYMVIKFVIIGDDLGSDHLPIEISIDAQPYRNTHTNPIRYKFDQTDREVFESTLEATLSSGDIPEHKSTQDIDKYPDFYCYCYQHCSR